MNRFKGKIDQIYGKENIHQLKIKLGEVIFSALIIDHEINKVNYKIGDEVEVFFKDSEVFLGKDYLEDISVQNQIKGEIIKIEEGDVLSRVYLSTIIGTISSLISSTSLHRLNLQLNEEACAFIKTNELILNELASPTHHL